MGRLSRRIKKLFAQIPDIEDLFQAEEKELKNIDDEIFKTLDSFSISTVHADDMDRLEEIFKIKSDSDNIEERRAVLLARFRGAGTTTIAKVKSVAEAFGFGEVEVLENVPDAYMITITFVSILGIPGKINEFKRALSETIPAHLDLEYVFTWMTWDEFDLYNKTWNEWDSLNLMWDEFEKYSQVLIITMDEYMELVELGTVNPYKEYTIRA